MPRPDRGAAGGRSTLFRARATTSRRPPAADFLPGNPGNRLCNLIDDLLKPSIAVIDGVCTTGATELALACDLRIVAYSAQISDWHLARLGSGLGGWGASTRLSRLVGVAQAKDIILTGKVMDGREAHRVLFAQRVVPSEQLWGEAMTMAHAISEMSPDGVRMTMNHLSRVEDLSKEESLRLRQSKFSNGPALLRLLPRCRPSGACEEGIRHRESLIVLIP